MRTAPLHDGTIQPDASSRMQISPRRARWNPFKDFSSSLASVTMPASLWSPHAESNDEHPAAGGLPRIIRPIMPQPDVAVSGSVPRPAIIAHDGPRPRVPGTPDSPRLPGKSAFLERTLARFMSTLGLATMAVFVDYTDTLTWTRIGDSVRARDAEL
jgi:hypothetical protein